MTFLLKIRFIDTEFRSKCELNYLILDEKVLDTPSLDTRIRARDIINGEDMTMVKKTAFPFMITLLCVWALIIYVHALRTKDKK